MATGAKVGLLASGALLATAAVATGGFATVAASPLVIGGIGLTTGLLVGSSTVYGGSRGRRYIEQCKQEGRPVYAPTMLNDGLLHGLLNGGILTAAAVAIAAVTFPASIPLATGIAFAIGATATVGLGYYQGEQHLQVMAKDYYTAISAQEQKDQSRGIFGKTKDMVFGKSANDRVTSKDMETISNKLEARKTAHVDQLAQDEPSVAHSR